MASSLYIVCVMIAINSWIKKYLFLSTKWLTQYFIVERLCLRGSEGSGQVWKAYSPGRSEYLININWRKAIGPPIVNWCWEIVVIPQRFCHLFYLFSLDFATIFWYPRPWWTHFNYPYESLSDHYIKLIQMKQISEHGPVFLNLPSDPRGLTP